MARANGTRTSSIPASRSSTRITMSGIIPTRMPICPTTSRGSRSAIWCADRSFVECPSCYRAEGDPRFASVGEVEYRQRHWAAFRQQLLWPIRACAGIVGRVDLMMGSFAAR